MEEWEKTETIALWVTLGVLLVLLLLAFIILLVKLMFNKMVKARMTEAKAKLKHQQELFESAIETQEKERKRIAEDIHDALIGKLLVLQMENQINKANGVNSKLLEDSISVARRISHDLSPPLIEYTQLIDLLQEVMEPWKEIKTIDSIVEIRYDVKYSDSFKINLTRILQEVITNIIKHADATKIEFRYRQTKRSLVVQIIDNGVGFDRKQNVKGLGLTNIENRVSYLKGKYHIKSFIGQGTNYLFYFKMEKE
ncbi:MAG: ATP-binding protein [Flavobacteriales bacterium]|jgi:signal transduction histidine kinase|nr:ATP-binding protein [Flavobacteriales bacterium]